MHARYISSVLTGVAGGLVITASQAFAPRTAAPYSDPVRYLPRGQLGLFHRLG